MDPFLRGLQPLPHHVLGMHQRLHLPNVRVTPTRTASRCLFGIADPATTRAALDRIIREETERCIEKWDFDPMSGKPVEKPKRYLWEKFPSEDRPASPAVEASPPAAREGDDGEDGGQRRVKPTPGGAAIRVSDEGERSREARKFAPYRQERITDYWRKKKSGGEAHAKLQDSSNATGPRDAGTKPADVGQ